MKKKKKGPLPVLIAIILAVIVGSYTGTEKEIFGITFFSIYNLIGTLFINALTLVVVPLVASSVISGIAKLGSEENFRSLGLKTVGFYMATTLVAIIIGIIFVNIFDPGLGYPLHETPSGAHAITEQLQQHIGERKGEGIERFVLSIVPANIIEVFSPGRMLALIFFSIIFGYSITKIPKESRELLHSFWKGIFQVMIQIAHLVIFFLPVGVFCLVAKQFAETGFSSLFSVGWFFLTVIVSLAVFLFIVLPLFIRFVGKANPLHHFQAMWPALVTAFSTSSSSASLPITLDCVEKRAGVSNRIASFVIPLGTSINLSGSALYECVAALFVAQAYGLDLSFSMQFSVLLLALITSVGVAGVPAGSLVATLIILKSIGLPPESVALFLAVDRFLDMARTTVNVFSDSVCGVLVARSEGEKNLLTKELINTPL